MGDSSRNHIEHLKKRLAELEKTLALNEYFLAQYGEYMTEEYKAIVGAQNALIVVEIEEIKKEIGE